ncbi:MAG TPA: hypothetical protein VM425_19090 [Myxococcota bacterium]|nr:hypothetical protein [Myxococcota bacterium]
MSLVFPAENDAKNLARSVRVVAVLPEELSSCAALIDGSAAVGDAGYQIEDEVAFGMPLQGDPRPLDVQAGLRLFYAEAENEAGEVFVRGCTEAESGGSGVHTVTINLEWVLKHCQIDTDCDDDDPCTVDTCLEDECNYDFAQAGTACDDGFYCTTDDSCDGSGVCSGQQMDCSSLDDQCNKGVCNETFNGCEARPDREDQGCDDGLYCTTGETCQGGVCTGAPNDCDDGVDCTIDSCDAQEEACHHDPDDSLCDDGVGCTTDSCDEQNDCQHVPNAGGCPDYHIGPAADTCPHDDGAGQTTECDFEGATGLLDAADAAPSDGARFLLYDDLGTTTEFTGCEIDIPAESYVGAAPGIDPANVRVACHPEGGWFNGVIHLDGDNIHVERLTLISMAGSNATISAWPAPDDSTGASGGHLIENVVNMALQPEIVGNNSIEEALRLGSDTTVRNCHFSGFFENGWDLAGLSNTHLIGNTFAYFQYAGGPADVSDSSGIVIASNVFLALTQTEDLLLEASTGTTGLVVTGNVVEGYAELVAGLDPGDDTNVIQDNVLGEAELESPLVPKFLVDSNQQTGGFIPGEGISLDGVALDGRTDILPGAFQQRSTHSGPRRMTVRVGDTTCGGAQCEIDVSEDNEIQRAVFSSWPGGTIELYPYDSYAGDAIIPWGVALRGMGDQPEDVVLYSSEEDPLWSYYEMWERHAGVLVVLHKVEVPVSMELFTIVVDSDSQADDRAVMIEGSGNRSTPGWHILDRLRIEAEANGSPGLKQGLYLGDRVLVHDLLIDGEFASCIRFGVRAYDDEATPVTSDRVINLTCRLTGTDPYAPESVLDLASVTDAYFVNLAVETDGIASLFRAQRRSSGDSGVTALDVPQSYTAHSLTVNGYDTYSDGFDAVDGSYTEDAIDTLAPGDPFFVGPDDSHLDLDCTNALDNGVDPSSVNGEFSAGTSLDGVDRAGLTIDRGCYEQGN